MQVFFDNALNHVELLGPKMKISRDKVYVEQEAMKGKFIPLSESLTSYVLFCFSLYYAFMLTFFI